MIKLKTVNLAKICKAMVTKAKPIKELHDVDVSTSTMTNITDKIIPKIAEFKARQLEEIYPIIFLDAIFFKVKENGKIITESMNQP